MENPSYRSSFPIVEEDIQPDESTPKECTDNTSTQADETDLNCEEFDEVLDIVGAKGKFQRLLLYAVVCPITLIQPFFYLNAIFLLHQPDHWCHIPGRDNSTDLETWKSHHIPLLINDSRDLQRPVGSDGHRKYSRCTMFGSNGSIVECQMGWEYGQTDYKSTIPSEFDWVCDKANYPTNSFTVQALGNGIGTMVFGSLADKWGRKPVLFLAIFINVISRLVSLHVVKYHGVFLLMQFLVGTAFPAMFICSNMIVAEVSDKAYRGWIYACTWLSWVIGMSIFSLVVWICSEWYIIGLTTTLPGIAIFLYWFTMPESPRWLFSVGRLEESSKILMGIAECNGTTAKLEKFQLDKLLKRLYTKQGKKKGSVWVWTLFSRRRLAKNTILLTVCWSINIVVYYGITLNSTYMSGNPFLNFFLLAVIEIPAGLASAFLVGKIGRRWIQVFFFCFCAITCVVTALVVKFSMEPFLEIFFVTIAKFAVTVTYLIVYLQAAEIFPTVLRSTGNGFASTVGGLLGMFGPIIVGFGTYHQSYPYWLMSGLCLLGMICTAFIPETLNQNLPETIEDANEFGRFHKFWSLYPNSKLTSEATVPSGNSRNKKCSSNSYETHRI